MAPIACLLGNHVYDDSWMLRPAWVGAGVSIELVHFDRVCTRCKHLETVWADVEGDRSPLTETLRLADWLSRHGATVQGPGGAIRLPDAGDLPDGVIR